MKKIWNRYDRLTYQLIILLAVICGIFAALWMFGMFCNYFGI